ncbi:MAG: hypothetical protein FRX49_01569 [Trebouxia sp. A1-2]|nr:MAG: hypothetical protein FRX49_01569 [Trebouxia sp. A1-2]
MDRGQNHSSYLIPVHSAASSSLNSRNHFLVCSAIGTAAPPAGSSDTGSCFGVPTTTASAEVPLLRETLSEGFVLVEADASTGGVPALELALVGKLAVSADPLLQSTALPPHQQSEPAQLDKLSEPPEPANQQPYLLNVARPERDCLQSVAVQTPVAHTVQKHAVGLLCQSNSRSLFLTKQHGEGQPAQGWAQGNKGKGEGLRALTLYQHAPLLRIRGE